MPSGRCASIAELPQGARSLLDRARRAVLATNGQDGMPHLVPICFAVREAELVMEVDDKPKRGPGKLRRVSNIEHDPNVALLVDDWAEDWTRLAWVMLRGIARIEAPGTATELLRAKYEQYAEMPLDGPVISIRPRLINWWTWT